MDTKGKGPLLLLLASTLVLNVASHPTCLEGARCYNILQGLNNKAIYSTMRMHFNSLDVFLEFLTQYSKSPSFIMTGIRMCHTANISAPAGQKVTRQMQHKDIIHTVIRYLHAWNDPLMHLALEAHRLTKLHDYFILKGRNLCVIHHELKELIKEISRQLDLEITDKVEYSSWSELPSLQSSDEKSLLFTFYKTLHCLVGDLWKIKSLLQLLKCQAFPDEDCKDVPFPSASEMVSNSSSFGKV